MNNRTLIIIVGVLVFITLSCIACMALTGVGALWFARQVGENGPIDFGTTLPTEAGPTPEVVRTEQLPPTDTLEILQNTIVPENDPVELAARLEGIHDVQLVLPAPDEPYEVGDERSFWIISTDDDETFETQATLRYATDLVYFWVENDVSYDQADLEALVDAFEEEIYPTNRSFFGSEWFPGIDNDPHIHMLYSTGLGFNVAGYFSSGDETPPDVFPFSNAAEMFMISADNAGLDEEYTYGVLAHEFQHMIHWYRDRNESSWINEGFSEVASLLNGYHYGGFADLYLDDPDIQLDDWPNDDFARTPHYGASLLHLAYFLDRFGDEATQALVGEPENSFEGIDRVLQDLDERDPLTGEPLTSEDVVLDWAVANYLGDPSVADGRYAYNNYPILDTLAGATDDIRSCEPGALTRDVHQYGVDYIRIACDGKPVLRFEGSTQTGLLPTSSYSGDFAFWSNKGDESDMTLTQSFDFSGAEGPITLSYRTWYDIETDWDYLYVEISSNGGQDWAILETPSGTESDPNGNNYGWGYTGLSGGDEEEAVWIEESLDLSDYAGQEVLLRFEYVTDASINGEGLLLDDVRIDAAGYFTDFETDSGGWEANGFARVSNILPQTFRLALIAEGDETTVQILELPAGNELDIPLDFENDVDAYTLVVIGSTRFTRQLATYQIDFLP